MNFKLYWSGTGDSFDIESVDDDLCSWFVERCNTFDSNFTSDVYKQDRHFMPVDSLIDDIKQKLQNVNQTLAKLKMTQLEVPTSFYDQFQLNKLHKDWIKILHAYPKIENLLYKLDATLFDDFHAINRSIHKLETSFSYTLRSVTPWREPNPFYGRTINPGVYNIVLTYPDHGRNSYEKWVNFEEEPNDDELSQWKNIGSILTLNLVRPYQMTHSLDYLKYCEKHNVTPSYMYLPLGNLANIHNTLGPVREIMNRNLKQADNYLKVSTS